ncbi:hypothetical protein [Bradyrhizobium sp. WSM1743]|uniref:hypothetical protein n=1 Tax=Bradyrhizobium sp. WSM1743 TaxID=318996 RepID=UPI0004287C1B|nr:hypothetical protein [Bradyrhizobium sp. WSM1743]
MRLTSAVTAAALLLAAGMSVATAQAQQLGTTAASTFGNNNPQFAAQGPVKIAF